MEDDIDRLHFTTGKHLIDSWDSDHCLKTIEVFPFNKPWNYTLLSAFLNEHGNFQKAARRAYQMVNDNHKFTFVYKDIENLKIYLNIFSNIITVSMSTTYIKQTWNRKHIIEVTNIGVGRKKLINYKQKTFIFYDVVFSNPKDGTKALLLHRPLIFNSIYDFSNVFHYFAKRITGFPINDDTFSLSEYIDLWIRTKKARINSLVSLQNTTQGYLKMNLQPIQSSKK